MKSENQPTDKLPQLLPQVSTGFPRRTNSYRISQTSPAISFFDRLSGCPKCSLDSTIGRPPTRVNRSSDLFQIFSNRIRSTPIQISSRTSSVRQRPNFSNSRSPRRTDSIQVSTMVDHLLDFVRAPTGIELLSRTPTAGRLRSSSYGSRTSSPNSGRG